MSDLIKRSDAIEEVANYFDLIGFARVYAKSIIDTIPTADRPMGEWIRTKNFTVVCSNCKCEFTDDVGYSCISKRMILPNFCLNCGARMEGADDE